MKLANLTVKNYRKISDIESNIKIDNIVILIGQNNAGKSTILDAYEAFASMGKELDITHFHNESDSLPIEIMGTFNQITPKDIETISQKWCYEDPELGTCIKVRLVWNKAGEKGKKQSYDPIIKNFVDGGVGGWDTLIKSRIPQPLRIKPNESNETTQNKIAAMLKEHVKTQLKKDGSATKNALDQIEELGKTLFNSAKDDFDKLTAKVSSQVSEIFPGSLIEIVPKSKDTLDEKFICSETYLKVSCEGGSNSPLCLQGTGLQRALLWSTLSAISETPVKGKTNSEAKILLIDEPEAFLHPPTIRNAREALYNFALNSPDWQVIATTHSPIFIDLSKSHTTIVRVDSNTPEERYVSTDKVSFDEPEKQRLQMIRACNPIVNEFFFYDKIVLVEGETEQVIVNHIASMLGMDIHVINCFGKANIPLFARVLNHFKLPYIIIHDSDTPKSKRKTGFAKNGMWTINEKIRETAGLSPESKIYVQIPNFEGLFFEKSLSSGKVDNAILALLDDSSDEAKFIIETYKGFLTGEERFSYKEKEGFDELIISYITEKSLENSDFWQL